MRKLLEATIIDAHLNRSMDDFFRIRNKSGSAYARDVLTNSLAKGYMAHMKRRGAFALLRFVLLTAAISVFGSPAIAQERQWRVNVVSPTVWHSTPEAAAYAYADWYCALPASQGQYTNCTPEYVTVYSWPSYRTKLQMTRVSDGATVGVSQASIVYRTDPVQPPPPNDLKQIGCDSRCPGKGDGIAGNPINAGTGNKYQVELDYAGHGAFPLRFERFYNSKAANTDVLGPRWNHTYGSSVEVRLLTTTTRIARVRRPSGRVYTFTLNGTAWQADPDVVGTLTWTATPLEQPLSWTFKDQDDSLETFDGAGRLLSITNRAGATQNLTYNAQGRLSTVSDSFGRQVTFAYDAQNRLSTLTDPGMGVFQYGYSASGMLASVTYPDLTIRQYHYNESAYTSGANLPQALTGITDESTVRFATYRYDMTGRAIRSTHAGGANDTLVSYPTSTSATVTDAAGNARTFTFSTVNGVRKIAGTTGIPCFACGEFTSYSYDTSGNVSSRQDANGNMTSLAFDLTRNLETSRTEAFGTPLARTVGTAWHSTFRLPTTVTEANRTTTFTHDANGRVLTRTVTDTATTPNAARSWTYAYNTTGQVLTEDGPRTDVADVTTYTYNSCATGNGCGQVSTVTNALGHTTTYNSYNAHGQPTQITHPNNLVTGLSYDLRRRLTDRCVGATLPTCAGGELTHLDYWPTGLLKKVTNPDGSSIEYIYDGAHRLTEIKDGVLNRIVYTLDAMGNRTAENTYDPASALRRTHTRLFNSLNQLWKDVNAAGTSAVTTTFGYDNNGNQTSVAAPLGRNSANTYDELNRLEQMTDPASGVTLFGYDANDNLTSVTDPRSLVTSYVYNGFGDLETQTSPDTGLTTNTHDSGGNLDTSTDARGAVTAYSYDAANRMTSASFTLGGVTDQTIAYAYDAGANQKGLLTSAIDANHDLAWTYDSHGRITGKGQTVGGVTLAMGYGYNASGQLAQTVLPSGATIGYGYNAIGQVTSVTLNGSTTILSGITYDPFGPITGWTWGNGASASRDFDTDGKVTQIDNANGASLKNYGYDDAFRITALTDASNSALSWTFDYDNFDRLNAATSTSVTQGWTYDANGNRLSESGTAPSTYTNSATSNRVNSIAGSLSRSYSYDAVGNTLSYGSATFTYNNRGRIATASNAGTTATYTYNALGQRVRRATSSVTTLYVYDEAGRLAGEYTATGALIQETVWLGDMPIATLRPDGSGGVIPYYVHADHLNTPRLVTDTGNNIRWRWDSDAFGTTPPNQDPSGLGAFEYNLRFPGQQYDGLIGLHYNYLRDYDPAIGRYVESDPIGLDGGINTFAYAFSDPILREDRFGLSPFGRNSVEGWCLRYPTLCKQQERWLYNKLKRPKKKNLSKKEAADDCPSWAKDDGGPLLDEKGKDYAKRLMDEKYGEGGWDDTGPGSEFSQIKKWADRAFEQIE